MTPAPAHYRRALFPIASHLHGPMWVPATLPASCTPRTPVSQFQAIWPECPPPSPPSWHAPLFPDPLFLSFSSLCSIVITVVVEDLPCDRPLCQNLSFELFLTVWRVRRLWLWAAPCPPRLLVSWRVFCVEGPPPPSSNTPACFLCPPPPSRPDEE